MQQSCGVHTNNIFFLPIIVLGFIICKIIMKILYFKAKSWSLTSQAQQGQGSLQVSKKHHIIMCNK